MIWIPSPFKERPGGGWGLRGAQDFEGFMNDDKNGRFAILIPVYNHAAGIGPVIERARGLGLPVWVVDDGSTDGTAARLGKIEGITVIRHGQNRGKGAALLTGFAALAGRADWAVTLDADGQHDPNDVPGLIRAIPTGSRPIVIGRRVGMVGEDVPWTSRFGRGFSNFWVRCAGGAPLSDTQSGMRIYPLPETAGLGVRARRFQFEVEVLVRARWAGIPVIETPVGVSYRPGMKRISHFRPCVDFCRNSETFTRLIFLRLFRWASETLPVQGGKGH
jgi:glycosyltransferase involved in cell wall biosynthesis